MQERILNGLNLVDPSDHVVTGRYKPRTEIDDDSAVEGGNPSGRIAVFSRLISSDELDQRRQSYAENPEDFYTEHITNLAK